MANPSSFQCSECGFLSSIASQFLNHPCFITQAISDGYNTQSSTIDASDLFTQVNSAASIEVTNTQTGTETLSKWDDSDVRLRIESYSKEKQSLKKGKITKKVLFDRVARNFNSKSKVNVTGEQCQRKWNKMEQKYKEIEDHNRKTGRANKNWKFMDDMAECMEDSPKINPAYTFDTSSSCCSPAPSTCSTSDTSNGGNGDVTSDTSDNELNSHINKLKSRKRKRKSKSSASEMLDFLKDYSEKREKAEDKKVELLREMHEGKKQFFSQFLEVLKNK